MPREGTLDKITVITAGTPVQVITTDLIVHSYMVEAWPTNLGKMWGGKSGLVKATGVGVRFVLGAPTLNAGGVVIIIPAFSNRGKYAMSFNLKELFIDADNSGEAVIVSYNQM